LGAGLGTRLRPLTDSLPKPLVPVFHKPLITFALDHLLAAGVGEFVINTHHLAAQFKGVFGGGFYRGQRVTLVHEPDILETGGGIKNARPWIGENPFIVYSGDILTDLALAPLIAEHFRRGNDVTLALRETGFSPSIALRDGRVVDIRNRYGVPGEYDFANVSIWNPSIFDKIPAGRKISFVPILTDWIGAGGKIGGLVLNENEWFNIGSRQEYLAVHRTILESGWSPPYLAEEKWPLAVSPLARIAPSARIEGFSSIGPGVEIGEGAVVRDSVVWEGAKIASRSRLEACIVRAGQSVEGILRDADI